jgi:hypothetical protein
MSPEKSNVILPWVQSLPKLKKPTIDFYQPDKSQKILLAIGNQSKKDLKERIETPLEQ